MDSNYLLMLECVSESWNRETSYDPDGWSEDNPSYGQCAVTALVLNDLLGGQIYRCVSYQLEKRVSHYFNIIYNEIVDLTRGQFSDQTVFTFPEIVSRDYLLSDENTKARYLKLKNLAATLYASKVSERGAVWERKHSKD